MTSDSDGSVSRSSGEDPLAIETVPPVSTGGPEYQMAPFNPLPGREMVRRWLAMTLVGLLALVVLSILVATIGGWLSIADAKELVTLLVMPILTLTSAATGFFYGTKPGD